MLSLNKIQKSVDGSPLYSDVSFQVLAGEKVGLVGPNGAGKTTLFRLIVGETKADHGSVGLQGGTRLSYFSQKSTEMRGRSALEEVMAGNLRVSELTCKIKEYENKLNDLYATGETPSDEVLNETLEKLGDLQTEFEKLGGYGLEQAAQEILQGLGIEENTQGKQVEEFSGGQKMRIALAKTLVVDPDLILMDEPTNYLDLETIQWLEEWLKSFKGAILLTTHDREFMNKVITKTIELNGDATIFSGNYDFYLKEKEIREKQLQSQFQRQQDMLKKEEQFIAKFQARASHAAQVQSRVKKLEKIDRVEVAKQENEIKILLPELGRGSDDVFVIKELHKEWPINDKEKKTIFSGLNAHVKRQSKTAVVGVNGAGKSTLLQILASKTSPTSGEVKQGPSTKLGYFGQSSYDELVPELDILEQLRSFFPKASDGLLRNIAAAFLFYGDDIYKKIKFLSGGEKTRLILAGLLGNPHNALILDEPTNHLDIKSREAILDALKRYQGTLLIVSHDRHFLYELVDQVLEIDQGEVRVFQGRYREYLDSKKN